MDLGTYDDKNIMNQNRFRALTHVCEIDTSEKISRTGFDEVSKRGSDKNLNLCEKKEMGLDCLQMG